MNSPYVLPGQAQKVRTGLNIRWSRQITAWLFLLPAIVLFALFAWYPILKSVEMSFQDVSLGGESTWVGLDNYALMLKDPAFAIVWQNSLQFAVWSVLLGYLVPVGLAILVREMRVGQGFFRIVYFLPTVVPAAISVLVWRFI
ncbi:MAG: sugar ABC transporter permease, partial [Anaerolineae bacterium]|nr:sugar ABC transporter permease [Anaerolineae bacterium]